MLSCSGDLDKWCRGLEAGTTALGKQNIPGWIWSFFVWSTWKNKMTNSTSTSKSSWSQTNRQTLRFRSNSGKLPVTPDLWLGDPQLGPNCMSHGHGLAWASPSGSYTFLKAGFTSHGGFPSLDHLLMFPWSAWTRPLWLVTPFKAKCGLVTHSSACMMLGNTYLPQVLWKKCSIKRLDRPHGIKSYPWDEF